MSTKLYTEDNLRAALQLAEAGCFIHPCRSDKTPLTRWRDVSTTDADAIRSWWKRWPDAIPAIDVGKSGLFVIDCDRHGGPDGVANFEKLIAGLGLDLSAAPVVETPSGGFHYYFLMPKGD